MLNKSGGTISSPDYLTQALGLPSPSGSGFMALSETLQKDKTRMWLTLGEKASKRLKRI